MYVREHGLWPTWLSVPVLYRHAVLLYAQFRVFDVPEEAGGRNPKQWRLGDGGPPGATWDYYYLLTVYLSHGPWDVPHCRFSPDSQPGFTVKRLVLDVQVPPAGSADFSIMAPTGRTRDFKDYFQNPFANEKAGWPRRVSVTQDILAAENLAYFLWCELLKVLSYTMSYGRTLYEGIGSIEISVGGEHRKTIDVNQLLLDYSKADHLSTDPGSFTLGRSRRRRGEGH